MLLGVVATMCLLVSSTAFALALGVRTRSDLATAVLGCALLDVVVLFKLLLLAGWFRPGAVTVSSALVALVSLGVLRYVPGPRRRALGALDLLRRARRTPTDRSGRLPRWGVPLLAGVVIVYAYRAVMAVRLPPMDMDSLWYHLVSVSGWVRTGQLVPAIENLSHSWDLGWTVVSDTYPRDFELSSAWFAVFTHSTDYVQLTQIGYAVLLFTAVFGICRRLGASVGVSLLGSCTVVLAPAVTGQVYLMYADVARAAVPAAAWHLMLIALPRQSRGRGHTVRWLLFAGAVLGVAAGIKASNLYFVPAAALTVALLARRGRRAASMALLGVGTAVTGTFWYALTWIRWGSPVWPVALGPFHGTMNTDDLVNVQRPQGWQHLSDVDIMVRSWWGAVSRFGQRSWYAEFTGQLGLAWLFVLLPAILLLLALPVVTALRGHRRGGRAAYAVVLPFTVATLAAPGQWFSRYTIPLLVAGAAAFAVLAGELARHRARIALVRPATPVLGWTLTVTTALCAVPGLAWSNFDLAEDPAHRTSAQVVQALGQPGQVRHDYGVWGLYPGLEDLPDGARIGFCEEDTVRWYTPMLLIGQHMNRTLVDLGHCGDVAGAQATMARMHVSYLYLSDSGSSLGPAVLAANGAGMREVVRPRGPDPNKVVARVWALPGH